MANSCSHCPYGGALKKENNKSVPLLLFSFASTTTALLIHSEWTLKKLFLKGNGGHWTLKMRRIWKDPFLCVREYFKERNCKITSKRQRGTCVTCDDASIGNERWRCLPAAASIISYWTTLKVDMPMTVGCRREDNNFVIGDASADGGGGGRDPGALSRRVNR